MTKESVIEKMIATVEENIGVLNGAKIITESHFAKSKLELGGLKHYLYLSAQSTIDLAEAVISLKNLRRPSTLSESFEILHEAKIIDFTLMQKMIKMAGFRNILAHEYRKVKLDEIYSVLQNDLGDIEKFLKEIKTKLKV